jgi:hypothetical protein
MTDEIKVGARVSWPRCLFSGGRRRVITQTGVVESLGVTGWVWVLPDGRLSSVPVERAQLTVTTGPIERVASDYAAALKHGDYSGREG